MISPRKRDLICADQRNCVFIIDTRLMSSYFTLQFRDSSSRKKLQVSISEISNTFSHRIRQDGSCQRSAGFMSPLVSCFLASNCFAARGPYLISLLLPVLSLTFSLSCQVASLFLKACLFFLALNLDFASRCSSWLSA